MTSGSLPSLHEVVQNNSHSNAPYVTESWLLGSNRLSLAYAKNNPAGHYPDPPTSEYAIAITTKGAGHGKCDLGTGAFSQRHKKGALALVSPGPAADFQIDYDFDLLIVGVPTEVFDKAFDAVGTGPNRDLEQLHSSMIYDATIESLLHRMHSEATSGNPYGGLFADHVASSVAALLLGLAGRSQKPDSKTGPLTKQQLAFVHDLMMDHLQERLTLDKLAGELGYDVFRFSRAFKAATGQTAYQYLMMMRLERGRDRLIHTNESLANISYDCGFSSQAHFTAAFTKYMGVSPGAFREELRR
ncbi:MAG: AraC family transcriptional regulator [Pseudomonadota bacterium]